MKGFLEVCQGHSIVHVATHGVLNESFPDFSFIAFSQNSDALNLSELLELAFHLLICSSFLQFLGSFVS